LPIAQLNDRQKVALIDGVLNVKSSQPAQVEQQIDEFKQTAAKLQQGQDYFALLESRSLKLQHPSPTSCSRCAVRAEL
jgi:flagellar motor switch protein FliG